MAKYNWKKRRNKGWNGLRDPFLTGIEWHSSRPENPQMGDAYVSENGYTLLYQDDCYGWVPLTTIACQAGDGLSASSYSFSGNAATGAVTTAINWDPAISPFASLSFS